MTDTEIILKMARKAGVIRRQDVVARGIHPEYLRRLRAKGLLVRVSRGFYMLPDSEVSEHHSLADSNLLTRPQTEGRSRGNRSDHNR